MIFKNYYGQGLRKKFKHKEKKAKLFFTGCPKSADVRGGETNFFDRGIHKNILGMVTNFQVWVA